MITKTTIRNSVLVFLILVAVLVYALVFALTSASAQSPARLGDILPAGIVYNGIVPLDAATVDAWRGAPVVAEVGPGPNNLDWVDTAGLSWAVQYNRGYAIRLDGGGRAMLVFGSTRDPELVFVTVAYESLSELLPSGRIAWHCQGAVIVERAAVEGGAP